MAYTFSKASDPLKIAEQEYASASEIRFTTFTSCIGVIARKGGTLTGIHLVMKAKDDSVFDTTAATAALALLPDSADQVWVIGRLNYWETPSNGVQPALQKLTSGFKSLEKAQLFQFADGVYGVTLDGGGKMEITFDF